MGLAEVSNILWRERNLLELLLFKLEEEQLVLAAGRTRWLARATQEVELVLEEIRGCELERAVEIAHLAEHLGLGAEPSLRELAAASPPPWGGLLEQHRAAFLTATQEIAQLAKMNRELLAGGLKATEEALHWLVGGGTDASETYAPKRLVAARTGGGARLFDEVL